MGNKITLEIRDNIVTIKPEKYTKKRKFIIALNED